MVSWIIGTLIGITFLAVIYMIVKISKDFEKRQKEGKMKGRKAEKDYFKGGIQ